MNRLSRSTTLKIAAVLSFLYGVYLLIIALSYLALGAAALNATYGPNYSDVVIMLVFAIVYMISAYGVWRNRRWGIVLTIFVHVIDALMAAPGILFASTTFWWLNAMFGVTLDMATVVLCLWRDRKPTVV